MAFWCREWINKSVFIYKLSGPAVKIFYNLGLTGNSIVNYPDRESIDGVITSTGWQSDLEYNAIKWAIENDIPVSSYIDHWCNYRARFVRNDIECFPDEIWVGDDESLTFACDDFGLDVKKIRYIRNRYLADIKQKILLKNTIKKSILICIEPIRNGVKYEDVYSKLVVYLIGVSKKGAKVVIRDHPSNTDTGLSLLQAKLSSYFSVALSENELWEDLASAVAVVGYQSAVLAYACYLNVPAISYFPQKLEPLLPHKNIEYI